MNFSTIEFYGWAGIREKPTRQAQPVFKTFHCYHNVLKTKKKAGFRFCLTRSQKKPA
jgi:hypothetical protein